MSSVIVLGATGLIGSSLVDQLASQQNIKAIIAITRRPIESCSEKVINHVIDFTDLQNHKDLFKGDSLFSCLGTTKKQAGSIARQRMVDVDYQYQAALFASQNQVKHYLLVSSSGANTKSLSPYLKMKGELENKVRTLPFEKISIFQPSLLLGKRKHFRLGEVLGSHVLSMLCRLPVLKSYRPISGEQVAKKMIHVSLHDNSAYNIYQLDELFS